MLSGFTESSCNEPSEATVLSDPCCSETDASMSTLERSRSNENHSTVDNDDFVDDSIKFSPPLYWQRYERVQSILKLEEVTSVCDFGCAECRALAVFRSIDTVQRLIGVDIERGLLANNWYRLEPLISDFLFRRRRPLHIDVFHGSLLDYDHRLNGVDAVTLIEVIEHLTEADLVQLPKAIFGMVSPRLVVMTTPNSEFNVLFPSLIGFRHPDHKFEWTRHQFEQWCISVASMYSYAVVFGGVGDPPAHKVSVGHCSQYAVFTRLQTVEIETSDTTSSPYECIHAVDYPVAYSPATIEEAIRIEAEYYINLLARPHNIDSEDDDHHANGNNTRDDDVILIYLTKLMSYSKLQQACSSNIDLLRQVLQSSGYSMSADGSHIVYRLESRSHSDVSDDYDDDAVVHVMVQNEDSVELAECWD